ncbi:carbohydrate kinase [Clostridium sp. MD294]|uniref:carbohydrate kinase family protein n=1 Tax=Clostridium sp. MD294 TaxID=97138 RepID=UPI0002CC8384|nr:carbohydrate kinase [Clostridium sp. MD294]NDO46153.1 carbohydrate kinase [Clostridium sp. MD294]USF30181.1 Fructokinase [Clostridium sp. MD294]
MKKLVAIGEALIDFIPTEKGCSLGEVDTFHPVTGGAPANVCGAYTKLGGISNMITQLGKDAFGDKIEKDLKYFGINTEHILRTDEANTCLAFVSLMEDGNREFSFYRKPSADMLLQKEDIDQKWFKDSFALHFCSVSLGEYPMKYAHKTAIEYAKKAGAMISFDPNIRLPLWDDHEALKKTVLEFLPEADILKISDEELEFITGCKTIEQAKDILFKGNVKLVLFTKGADGAEVYTKQMKAVSEGKKVKAVDTTGAGDAFIGSFLYQLSADGVTAQNLSELSEQKAIEYMDFSNAYCAYSVQGKGAIASYATMAEMKK